MDKIKAVDLAASEWFVTVKQKRHPSGCLFLLVFVSAGQNVVWQFILYTFTVTFSAFLHFQSHTN